MVKRDVQERKKIFIDIDFYCKYTIQKGESTMLKYYGLFDLLNRRGMKKTDLLQIMSSGTLAKLSRGEVIKSDIIDKICEYLKCQPGDIMEYVEIETEYENNGETSIVKGTSIYNEETGKTEI